MFRSSRPVRPGCDPPASRRSCLTRRSRTPGHVNWRSRAQDGSSTGKRVRIGVRRVENGPSICRCAFVKDTLPKTIAARVPSALVSSPVSHSRCTGTRAISQSTMTYSRRAVEWRGSRGLSCAAGIGIEIAVGNQSVVVVIRKVSIDTAIQRVGKLINGVESLVQRSRRRWSGAGNIDSCPSATLICAHRGAQNLIVVTSCEPR